jgi:lysyl-tRNA synthetase class 2
VARAVVLAGMLGVVGGALPMPAVLGIVPGLVEGMAPHGTRAATITIGMLLVVLARGLRRRKRRAWQLTVVLTVVEGSLHLARDFDLPLALITALVVVLLIATRGAFTGMPDPRSLRHTAAVFLGSAAIAVTVGFTAVLLDGIDQLGPWRLSAIVREVLLGLVGITGPLHYRSADHAAFATVTLALLGGAILVCTLAAALRPPGGPHALTETDEQRLRGLLDRFGRQDSLGYFALRRDKSVIFSPSGKAAIGYRVVDGVTLAAGDPLGDPEAWPGAIREWLEEARRYAWIPAVLAPSERGAAAYHRAGLDALELGDEAVVHVDDFTLEGRAMRNVRQAVARARRSGYRVDVTPVRRLTAEELAEAAAASARWRDGAQERGFAMALGRLGDAADEGCVLVRCRDREGRLSALLHFVPWGLDGLSLDLMRRSPDVDNGVVELMVVELLGSPSVQPLRRVSLNFAVFRSVLERGERLGAGPVLRLWRRVLVYASRLWQIETLYRANAKYRPEWVPRYLCFASARDLPTVTLSVMQAEAFIVRPRLADAWRRLPRRRPGGRGSPGEAGQPRQQHGHDGEPQPA